MAEAVKDVMEVCPKGATVVVESTVSPGTINKYVRPVVEERGFVIGEDINLVHAPERIIPGNMVYELKAQFPYYWMQTAGRSVKR